MNNLFYHITTNIDNAKMRIRWHSISDKSFLILNDKDIYYPSMHKWDTSNILNTKKETTFYTNNRYICDVLLPLTNEGLYSFVIKCYDEISDTYTFSYYENQNEFSFYALTDLQPKYNQNIKLLIDILNTKYNKSFVICSGDIIDCGGSEEEWTHILDNKMFNDAPFMSAVGDHEYWADDKGHPYPMYDAPYTYNELFNNPKNGVIYNTNYYFTYGNSLFVFLDNGDSNHATGDIFIKQAEWFKSVIIPMRNNYKYLFVIMHKAIQGSKNIDTVVCKYLTPLFEPLFEEARVTLVFSGHDHIYSRTNKINGVTYLDMGSSGAKRRNVDESFNDEKYAKVIDLKQSNYSCAAYINVRNDIVSIEVINTNNEIVDKFSIK